VTSVRLPLLFSKKIDNCFAIIIQTRFFVGAKIHKKNQNPTAPGKENMSHGNEKTKKTGAFEKDTHSFCIQ
jgi:hypothetical protein